ncbi:hypothetical protein Tco_0861316 [Tanacetum coccineum]|uniref:Uncharacterized protein n=1 Tax=Tanacetum coccineum TaxID=301880 RepID=A0ABQ5BN38_9ASTR
MTTSLVYHQAEEEHERATTDCVWRIPRTEEAVCEVSKCDYWLQQDAFLGHIVSADGNIMDPSKVEAITKWAATSTEDGKRRILTSYPADEKVGPVVYQIYSDSSKKGLVCHLMPTLENVEDGKHTEFSVDDDGVVWFLKLNGSLQPIKDDSLDV